MINRKALMRCLIASVILSMAAFSGCAQRDVNSNSDTVNSNSEPESSVIAYETKSEESSVSETVSEESSDTAVSSVSDTSTVTEKRVKIEAEVKSYEDGILCFEYEGNEYSLPMTKDLFENDSGFSFNPVVPSLSERIINNKFGEKVFAKIAMNENMDKIFLCDVINPNGKYDLSTPINNDNTVNTDKLYKMKRTGKSLCEFSNIDGTYECDLNDLPLYMKLDYPEIVFPITPDIYIFKDGKAILYNLFINVQVDADGVGAHMDSVTLEMYGKHNGFFGTVQTVNDDDTITVLLNDNVTYCTVPTYYNDGGEFVPGSEIVVLLDEDVDFFGTGGEHTYDYAVIVTNSGYCIDEDIINTIDGISMDKYTIENFNEYAYAVFRESWDYFSCTRIDKIEKDQ